MNRYLRFLKRYAQFKLDNITGNYRPSTCTFIVTDGCNARCVMCNYWKTRPNNELTLEEVDKLFSSGLWKGCHVTVSGGEPLLRIDLEQIIKIVHKRTGNKVDINTNSFLFKRMEKLVKECKEEINCVHISLDGLEPEHDRNRGITGAYKMVMKTIDVLKANNVPFKVGMTVTKENYKTIYKSFKEYMTRYGYFSFLTTDTAKHAYGDNTDLDLEMTPEQKEEIIVQAKQIWKERGYLKTWKYRLYDLFLVDWLRHNKRPGPCYAARYEIRVNPNGDIQPCHVMAPLGNIRKNTFDEIWNSQATRDFRKKFASCQLCYRGCHLSTLWVNPFKSRLLALKYFLTK